MCNSWCLDFSSRALPYLDREAAALEVGSLDVNGTVRQVFEPLVRSYYGVDIRPGAGVDEVLDVAQLTERLGPSRFDLVVSTEMIEHCFAWLDALYQMMNVLRPGGVFLLTTRSPGFPLHDHPADHWRFTRDDLVTLLERIGEVLEVEDDFSLGWPCGIGIVVRRRADQAALDRWLVESRDHRLFAVDPARDAFSPNNSHFLPFDQYSAYVACGRIIDALGMTNSRVLDMSRGVASRFRVCRPQLEVVHAPLGTDETNHGDFDCVVAIDTLEHSTPEQREEIFHRAARAKAALFFSEFNDESTASIVERLRELGFEVSIGSNGYLPWVEPLEAIRLRSLLRPGVLKPEIAPLLTEANRELVDLDFLEPGKRRVIAAVRGGKAALPLSSLESYREAARRSAAWWSRALPLVAAGNEPETDLRELATKHGTDKWGRHWYAQHYQTHFAPRRHEALDLLEIGVGGYEDPAKGGESLRMWKEFFPNGRIYGLDIHDKTAFEEDRIRIFRGSQVDPETLAHVLEASGGFDIIIDDGSHRTEHVIASFELLFPKLRDGGIYAVEDMQTSYWPRYGGSTDDDAPHTSMAFFKRLADGLNHAERIRPGYIPTFFDLNIASIHFYHNMVFVCRGRNDAESNVMRANVPPDWLL
jgi:hypothetical protein